MSKFIFKVFIFLINFILYFFLTGFVYAANCSLTQTIPNPINSSSDNATFKIDVGNNSDPDVSSWKMEFNCGVRKQQVDASKEGSNIISATIQRSRVPGQGCEFFAGNHTIQVNVVTTNGTSVNWCPLVIYTVTDSDALCKLSIDPATSLTPTSNIKVSGENLTPGGQFRLYIDKDDQQIFQGAVVGGVRLSTPSFSDLTIPPKYLSSAKHALYIKRENVGPILPGVSRFSGPLCPLGFTIGTSSSPGGVTGGTTGGSTGTISAIAGGELCDKDTGISTAIGCIHTSPQGFVKDFMTFIIGISGGLAFLMMLLGAFQMLTSSGNPETLNAGRERLTSAVIGLLIVIFAVLLLQIIGVDILKLGGFK